jgi:hypothetical protein
VFHVPLDRIDHLNAVEVDDLITLHGRYSQLAADKQKAQQRG